MKAYTVTYMTLEEANSPDDEIMSSVEIEADSTEEAGMKALNLPLPEGADPNFCHISPHDLEEDATYFSL
jgi:hypothetical protein